MHVTKRTETRRTFLGSAAKAGASLTAASSFSKILGANDRVRIGVLGAGGRAMQLVRHLLPGPAEPMAGVPQFATKHVPGAEVIAVADVYRPHRDRAAQVIGPTAKTYPDFRQVLDRSDIDAVIIASPDHWHTSMAIEAVRAGKDVYVEKPVTHKFEEGPKLIAAVEQSGQVVQTGTQQRSWKHYLRGKEIIDSGELGRVRLVESYWFLSYRMIRKMVRQMRIDQSGLDWKAWLGPAPEQEFSVPKFRVWRYFWDFGGGALGDLMSHAIDTVQWYMDSPTPTRAIAMGQRYDLEFECPDTVSCTLEYPKGFMATYTGNHATAMDFGSIIFRGSKATLEISRAALALYEEDVERPIALYNSRSRRWRPDPKVYIESEYEGTADNLANWLEGIRTRKTPNAGVRVGVQAAFAAHLGNAAMRAGTPARWDAESGRIVV